VGVVNRLCTILWCTGAAIMASAMLALLWVNAGGRF